MINKKSPFCLVLVTLLCVIVSSALIGCSKNDVLNNINNSIDEFINDEDNTSNNLLLNLPCVFINTQNSELPVNKVDYINCSFEITNTENENDAFAVTMKDSYGDKDSVGIRLRGNSTMGLAKKPYRIKFDKKQSFFGSEKNKNWVLLADYLDPSDMRNYVGLSLAEQFEYLDFTPSHHHVILYLNGQYQGVYLLTDHIDEKKGRTNVEEDFDAEVDTDFPFLLEMNSALFGMEGIEGVDWFKIDGFEPIEIKYPEADERDEAGVVYDYIHNYVEAVLTLLKNGNEPISVSFRAEPVVLSDLVDENSLMDFLLVNEIMGNWDAAVRSIKICKSKDGKLKFGPVWDFDNAAIPAGNGNTPLNVELDLEIADDLFTSYGAIWSNWLSINGNNERLYDRFMEKRDCILNVVDQMFEYYYYIAPAVLMDSVYWYGENGAKKFEEQYEFLKKYLTIRYGTLALLLKP